MQYNLLHIGVGNVGRTVLKQVLESNPRLKRELGIELIYCGLFVRQAGIFAPHGLSTAQIEAFPSESLVNLNVDDCIKQLAKPFILIDTTSSDTTLPTLLQTLKRGGAVVMANKKPLSGTLVTFNDLRKLGGKRIFYETTVGAGLPVMHTLNTLLATGDKVVSIQGCLSGTLGFIFSQLENGSSFSQAVIDAKSQGFTEPDPRDDLSGTDVARKALIMARLIGQTIEIDDIKVESLYPKTMRSISKDEFMTRLPELDKSYLGQVEHARSNNQVLRYVATITPTTCTVELKPVDNASSLGRLRGTDNIIVIQTARYNQTPMVIQGPGAGLEVTATGLFGDILEATKTL